MQEVKGIFKPILINDERPEALREFPAVHVQPVTWGDMDPFNHLNNVAYYRYAESARISYLRAMGAIQTRTDISTILAASSCQYKRPVVYPDTLLIGVRTKKLGTTSVVLEYVFFSHAQQCLVAMGEAVMVRANDAGEKQAWSDDERAQFERFEGREFAL
ncbi:thioesterase [Moraxella caviae]|uniref:Acyl-CoA thioester hydrolase, YbgC/YbaW family n=1 Tax=Moraxella caviae TaxID=34060 RepID=A0A1T0ABZ1_9GAMM|nr:acyl-CoA thioesterase [Moraxella caviae]OOR93200.1 thioesterase [Moraxella caviae]STZ10472.1 acyl-CoA thioester hydrolase, YbgC/YbaW family [Moraxella caviae]VEW12796.1 acyl-CoA thioester hydrolase, YbgC/YbaW family [Moraxella caviae]